MDELKDGEGEELWQSGDEKEEDDFLAAQR